MKYSEWYMWSFSGSSIHIQNGSPVFPWARSFHLKVPRILSTTRSTVRVIGWMDASTSNIGIWLAQSFTRAPMLTWRIMWPACNTKVYKLKNLKTLVCWKSQADVLQSLKWKMCYQHNPDTGDQRVILTISHLSGSCLSCSHGWVVEVTDPWLPMWPGFNSWWHLRVTGGLTNNINQNCSYARKKCGFYRRDAMLARVFATATCLSGRPSVRLSVTCRYCA